jgi:carbon monoxide dehydrogenase subunit G
MIELDNSFTIPASLDESWRALLDIERIAPCVPGARLETVAGDKFEGSFKVKLGVTATTYHGTAKIVQRDARSYRAAFNASARETRGNGSAQAVLVFSLAPAAGETEVSVLTSLGVTGTAARLGQDALAKVAARLTGQFADRLREELAAAESEPAAAEMAASDPVSGEAGAGVAATDVAQVAMLRRPIVKRAAIAAGVTGALVVLMGVVKRGMRLDAS